ncbi:hypothetical protein [Rubrivivax benzoatilyticus]|uniref:Uncharacterized protein n=1 Tax=Rubrivivax benzoatilyticus TaxID=316997 RepID=A0ABX0HYY0_9BURK|nr:hypothetical protein [Rubrivivax benzoatilyticus]EGJ11247.1 hypothetical protein RBXJA2T_13004 [Rubrivivax benzoatilyticus JA2 = ATCC BAA-35]MCD0417835.1 hypothetical protein [Rubrivivax sp. JA1024]NHK99019.1 hypothetical protein [Rubrivivax benzoatilyticus]NHL25118.1 hypothetical protein [Rubrivivax benzoatilyticus]
MAEGKADGQEPAGAELLDKVRRELSRQQTRAEGPLYRVVEVGRDSDGRLVKHAQIWHSDLSVARRFGRALAANSVAQQVTVTDAAGNILEEISPPPPGVLPPGWDGWRDLPLPPLPRPKPAKPKPTFGSVPAALARSHPPAPPSPPPVLPVLGAAPAEAPAEPLPQTMLSQPGEAASPPAAKSGPDDDVEIVLPT